MSNSFTKSGDFPRDERGHFITRQCPECGNGKLQYEGDGVWNCDGLADPEDANKPLIACTYIHFDGEPIVPHPGIVKA